MDQPTAQPFADPVVQPIVWEGNQLRLLDQRILPSQTKYISLRTSRDVAAAITDLVVRGAPAIGISAAYGCVLGWREVSSAAPVGDARQQMQSVFALMRQARPTAVNLMWAVDRMQNVLAQLPAEDDAQAIEKAMETVALEIHADDRKACWDMAQYGVEELSQGSRVLTHCNTGALATGGIGTALGVITTAAAKNKLNAVYAGETRPWLQGSRLTMWELQKNGVAGTLVCDNAVAHLARTEGIDWLIVGADRVAANGDVANKIGTLSAALHVKRFGGKVMVVVPTSTIDLDTPNGDAIAIEQRDQQEVCKIAGTAMAPAGTKAWNPVFDITPAEWIDCIVTERGVARPDFTANLKLLCETPNS